MTRTEFLSSMGGRLAALAAASALPGTPARAERPNIVYLLCDDLGYGDVRFLNPGRGRIETPRIDGLARQGMAFTDAHSGSAVCTPTRYGVLTGRYSWRSRLQSGIVMGYSPPLIAQDRLTVAGLLKRAGYTTALIGKWHLGWGWAKADPAREVGPRADRLKEMVEGQTLDARAQRDLDNVDYTRPVQGGPAALGFDYFYGFTAPDLPPFVWIENDRVVKQPDRIARVIRQGVGAPGFEPFEALPALTRRVTEYIGKQAPAARSGRPFFLMYTLPSPHSPVVPTPEWRGKSGLGNYADWVMQTDGAIGEVLDALDRNGLAGNTLVVVTSDNGCAPYNGVTDRLGQDVQGKMRPHTAIGELEAAGHFASAGYRGYKADIWEGGHRVPFVVRWPGRVKAGSTSGEPICLTDLMATCAEMVNARLPAHAGEDSVSILPALLGRSRAPLREAVVHHSIQGKFAIRQGKWKLAFGPGSGGWSTPGDKEALQQKLPPLQLYDLSADPGERHNLLAKHPEVVGSMIRLLEKYIAEGRSTPGTAQQNDVAIDIWKGTAYSPQRP